MMMIKMKGRYHTIQSVTNNQLNSYCSRVVSLGRKVTKYNNNNRASIIAVEVR